MPCKNHPAVLEPLYYCSRCGGSFCADCVVELGGYLYCAPCKAETVGDVRAGVGPIGQLDLASVWKRLGAILIDGLLLSIPTFVLVGLLFGGLAMSNRMNAFREGDIGPILIFEGVIVLFSLGLWILYEGWMLSHGGQTLGKKALNLKVVTPDGNDLSTGQAWMRGVVRRAFDMVPCLGLVNILLIFGQERTCLHDIVVKTRVVNWYR